MDNKKIMIYAELLHNEVQPVTYELLSQVRCIFPQPDVTVALAVMGDQIDCAVGELSGSGADVIYSMCSPLLDIFHIDYFEAALFKAVEDFDPDILLTPATAQGEELAPTLGITLRTGVAAHCVDLQVIDGNFVQLTPAFGGKVISEIYTPHTRPQIASVKPGTFCAEELAPKAAEIRPLDMGFLCGLETGIRVLGLEETPLTGRQLEAADIVICGGYGVGNAENWQQLERLADKLGGATGYTRSVVDCGWVNDESRMIGTSGKTIKPKVYLGIGISGATHHVCGMKDAGVVISVNNDAEADVFAVSNYKVVADGMAIISALNELLEA